MGRLTHPRATSAAYDVDGPGACPWGAERWAHESGIIESEVIMARTLYRIYLYVVALVMLGFAGFGLGSLLHTLLLNTPLRGQYEPVPAGADLVQTAVLASTALVVALALGGVHYWLIRRDIAADPDAATGPVRALMLNLAQAIAAIIALFSGAAAF